MGGVDQLDALLERAGRDLTAAVAGRLDRENEELRQENRGLLLVTAILLRKLGGETFVSDGEQIAEDAALVRVPDIYGYRLLLREQVRPALEIVRGNASGTGRGATDKEV